MPTKAEEQKTLPSISSNTEVANFNVVMNMLLSQNNETFTASKRTAAMEYVVSQVIYNYETMLEPFMLTVRRDLALGFNRPVSSCNKETVDIFVLMRSFFSYDTNKIDKQHNLIKLGEYGYTYTMLFVWAMIYGKNIFDDRRQEDAIMAENSSKICFEHMSAHSKKDKIRHGLVEIPIGFYDKAVYDIATKASIEYILDVRHFVESYKSGGCADTITRDKIKQSYEKFKFCRVEIEKFDNLNATTMCREYNFYYYLLVTANTHNDIQLLNIIGEDELIVIMYSMLHTGVMHHAALMLLRIREHHISISNSIEKKAIYARSLPKHKYEEYAKWLHELTIDARRRQEVALDDAMRVFVLKYNQLRDKNLDPYEFMYDCGTNEFIKPVSVESSRECKKEKTASAAVEARVNVVPPKLGADVANFNVVMNMLLGQNNEIFTASIRTAAMEYVIAQVIYNVKTMLEPFMLTVCRDLALGFNSQVSSCNKETADIFVLIKSLYDDTNKTEKQRNLIKLGEYGYTYTMLFVWTMIANRNFVFDDKRQEDAIMAKNSIKLCFEQVLANSGTYAIKNKLVEISMGFDAKIVHDIAIKARKEYILDVCSFVEDYRSGDCIDTITRDKIKQACEKFKVCRRKTEEFSDFNAVAMCHEYNFYYYLLVTANAHKKIQLLNIIDEYEHSIRMYHSLHIGMMRNAALTLLRIREHHISISNSIEKNVISARSLHRHKYEECVKWLYELTIDERRKQEVALDDAMRVFVLKYNQLRHENLDPYEFMYDCFTNEFIKPVSAVVVCEPLATPVTGAVSVEEFIQQEVLESRKEKTLSAKDKRIAEKQAAAEARRIADETAAAEAKLIVEKKKAAKARRKEEKKAAAKAEAERIAKEEAAVEAKRIADEKAAAKARRKEEKAAAEARAKAAEAKRIAEEKSAAEARAKAAEDKRIAEEKAVAEARAKAAEAKRIVEEKAAAEARAKAAEAKRIAEEKAVAEARAKAAEAKRIAEEKAAAEARAKAAKDMRIAEEKAAAEARAKAAEDKRIAEEKAAAEARAKEEVNKRDYLSRIKPTLKSVNAVQLKPGPDTLLMYRHQPYS